MQLSRQETTTLDQCGKNLWRLSCRGQSSQELVIGEVSITIASCVLHIHNVMVLNPAREQHF